MSFHNTPKMEDSFRVSATPSRMVHQGKLNPWSPLPKGSFIGTDGKLHGIGKKRYKKGSSSRGLHKF